MRPNKQDEDEDHDDDHHVEKTTKNRMMKGKRNCS